MNWRPRLSILQLMKLVVYCAVACACIAPMWHLWRAQGRTAQGLISVALFEAILVPLVWTGVSLVLVRPGVWRDGLICVLLLCSVTVALGCACWLLVYTVPAYWTGGTSAWALTVHLAAVTALAASALFLSHRLKQLRGSI